jgi:hypothetical protein
MWSSTAVFVGGIGLAVWGLGAIVLAPAVQGSPVDFGPRLFLIGLAAFVAGAIGLGVVKPRFGPQGYVSARWARDGGYVVELRNVHPAFAMAVDQLQRERTALYGSRSQFREIEVN